VLPGGGALARVDSEAITCEQRQAPINYLIHTKWTDPTADETNIAWTKKLAAEMKPFASGRVYLNFIGDEGEARVRASLGLRAYARLQALKDRYDPDNLFSLNQNIKPSGALSGEVAATTMAAGAVTAGTA
jgi:hypothetical protein